MVIDLTVSEKTTFFRFVALYLGSSFILMSLIGILYFQNEKRLYFDLIKSNMQNEVSKVSSQIILSHMRDSQYNPDKLLKNKDFRIAFYNNKKQKIFGNLKTKIDFSKKIMQNGENFILIDDSTVGHLGVYYIAIEENLYSKQVTKIFINILLIFIALYSVVALIGYYLAKLFLKPLRNEREKLNNFIKDTTHELNTPISAIMMSTENKSLNEKQIERIRLSARRVSEVYHDLTYIFLENNSEKKNITTEKLNELIKEQLEYFVPLALKKKIEITYELDEFIYDINRDDFIRVVNNIISNAIKYNNVKGKIDIKLKANTLNISDTGIGIDDKRIKDIYNRYYRATSEQGGFGIGLNIVNDVCKKYKIKIDVKSKLKEGTTFTLTF